VGSRPLHPPKYTTDQASITQTNSTHFIQHPEDEIEGSYLAYGNNFHRESAFVIVDITMNIMRDQTLG